MLFTQRIASLLNGVSQQPEVVRDPSQAEEQTNALSHPIFGLMKRPPMVHLGKLATTLTGWDTAFLHSINRDSTERYLAVVVNGDIKVYDLLTQSEMTVQAPYGKAYLTDAGSEGFRAVTVGDTTILTNRGVDVAKGTSKSAAPVYEALVFVRQAGYGATYTVTIDGVDYSITTANGPTTSRPALSTQLIATDLLTKMTATGSLFAAYYTRTQYGSTLWFKRTDGRNFTVAVTDSLSDEGLKMVKGTVQSVEDLPKRAKDGMVVSVVGDPSTGADDFYVQYDDLGNSNQDGVWTETTKPGVLLDLDETTMPHRLVRYGNIVGETVNEGSPEIPAISIGTNTETSYSWTHNEAGAGITSTNDQRITDHQKGVVNTPADFDGTNRTVQAVYNIDTSDLDQGQFAWVNLYKVPFGGGANSLLATKKYAAGQFKQGEVIEATGTFAAGDKLLLDIHYPTGSTPTNKALLVAPAPIGGDIGTGGSGTIIKRYTVVTFNGLSFPVGCVIELEVDGNSFTYTVAGSPASAGTVATALKNSIDAHANYVATNPSAFSIRINHATLLEPHSVVATVSVPSSTTFYNSGLSMVDDEHVGNTIKNLTDGSSGVITSNTTNTVEVAALTGGADNSFAPGDVCTIVGSGTYFVFEPIVWNNRTIGDDTSNPFPSFVDQPILEVFFYQNRLGFTAGENVILSSSGDLYNFFRYSVTQLAADDLIDVKSAHADVTVFHSAALFEKKLFLFSDKVWFELSGDPVLTPSTVRLDSRGSYPAARMRPVVAGRRMFFNHSKISKTSVLEYQRPIDEERDAEVVAITSHVPAYLDGTPVAMASDSSLGILAVLTTNKRELYIYSWKDQGDVRLQSSWSKWTCPNISVTASSTILGLDITAGVLYLVVKHSDGVYLNQIDLSPGEITADDAVSHLDRRLTESGTGVYNAGTNLTTWTLPYAVATNGSQGSVVVVSRSTYEILGSGRPSTTSVTAVGDHNNDDVYIGILYSFDYTFSRLYKRDDEGLAETDGRTKMSYFTLFYHDSWDFYVNVTVTDRDFSSRFFQTEEAGEQESGSLRFSVMAPTEQVTLQLASDGPNACRFSGAEWEGTYISNKRRI
jgi:hypothetical protein